MNPHEHLTIEDLGALAGVWRMLVNEADRTNNKNISETVAVSGGYAELYVDGAVVAHGLIMGNVSNYLEHGRRFELGREPSWYNVDEDSR